jgi:hypothetical protein
MKATVIEDAKVLTPNKEHKNFTETDVVITKGTEVEGEEKLIEGLRRGEPFTYRLFMTNDNKILYLNKVEPVMAVEATEVTLGADSSRSATTIDLRPAEAFSRVKMIGLVAGGVIGYAYARSKKMDNRKAIYTSAIGAIVGYVSGYVIDRNRGITVQTSK